MPLIAKLQSNRKEDAMKKYRDGPIDNARVDMKGSSF